METPFLQDAFRKSVWGAGRCGGLELQLQEENRPNTVVTDFSNSRLVIT